ncbi:MAG: hypothetical protein AAF901_09285 [Bacteroidota bacterium]
MNTRIFKIGFFVLLLVNGIMAGFLFNQGPPHVPLKDIKEKISDELQLNNSQKSKFYAMAKSHRNSMIEIGQSEKELLRAYFDYLMNETGPISRGDLLTQVGVLGKKKVLLTYEHFEELKSLCTDEQLPRFNNVMDEILLVFITKEKPPGTP